MANIYYERFSRGRLYLTKGNYLFKYDFNISYLNFCVVYSIFLYAYSNHGVLRSNLYIIINFIQICLS